MKIQTNLIPYRDLQSYTKNSFLFYWSRFSSDYCIAINRATYRKPGQDIHLENSLKKYLK